MVKTQKDNDTMLMFEGNVFGSKPKTDKFKLLLEKLVKTNKGKVKVSG